MRVETRLYGKKCWADWTMVEEQTFDSQNMHNIKNFTDIRPELKPKNKRVQYLKYYRVVNKVK